MLFRSYSIIELIALVAALAQASLSIELFALRLDLTADPFFVKIVVLGAFRTHSIQPNFAPIIIVKHFY